MKNRLVLFVTGYMILVLSSCLNSNEYEYDITHDAQIASFTIEHIHPDTTRFKPFADVVFTIDQNEGLIFNRDSMPFGTEGADSLKFTISATGYLHSLKLLPEATGEETEWSAKDTINFTDRVRLVATAEDGVTTKTYYATLNIHQVNPDSMVWKEVVNNGRSGVWNDQKVIPYRYGGKEVYFKYTSTGSRYELSYTLTGSNLTQWETLTLTGLPTRYVNFNQLTNYEGTLYVPVNLDRGSKDLYRSADGLEWEQVEDISQVVALLGVVEAETRTESALCFIINDGTQDLYASMNSAGILTHGETVHPNFPYTGYGSINYSANYSSALVVAAGMAGDKKTLLNSSWFTSDGLTWAEMTGSNNFSPRIGPSIVTYDEKFYLIGGVGSRSSLNIINKTFKDIYYSIDKGKTWHEADELMTLPEEFIGRGFSSLLVDDKNYMLLFGGKERDNYKIQDDLWKGRINRLGFEK